MPGTSQLTRAALEKLPTQEKGYTERSTRSKDEIRGFASPRREPSLQQSEHSMGDWSLFSSRSQSDLQNRGL